MNYTIKKCLFPAAGYGTRFLPATKAMPKEMLPIVDKPLIQYGAEECLEAKINEIGIVTGRGKQAIENHFDRNYELEDQLKGTSKETLLEESEEVTQNISFAYTRQKHMKGLGDAILEGKQLIGGEPFGVLLADDLCSNGRDGPGVMKQLVELYEKYQCSIVALEKVPDRDTHKYGVISGDNIGSGIYKINNMVEKPDPEDAPSNLAIIGRYILTPDIFEILEKTSPDGKGEVQITDALMNLAKDGKVIGYQFEGERFDCGSVEGYIKAQNYFFENGLHKKSD